MEMFQTVKATKSTLTMIATLCVAVLCTACVSTEEGQSLASSDRECRTTATAGSKMRQSVCLSKKQWAVIDAREAKQKNDTSATDEFFRRATELSTQSPPAQFDPPTGPGTGI